MSHCAAHQVTSALSFALKAGRGPAKSTRNHQSSPTSPSGAPGGQSGKSPRSVRREVAATAEGGPEWACR